MSLKTSRQFPSASSPIVSPSHALSTLADLTSKPIPAQLHSFLKFCNGTVSISAADCPVYDVDRSDCEDLSASLTLIQDQYTATSFLLDAAVSPLSILLITSVDTTFPIKYWWKILFCQATSTPLTLVSVGNVDALATPQGTVASHLTVVYVLSLTELLCTHPVFVSVVVAPIWYSLGTALSTSMSLKLQFSDTLRPNRDHIFFFFYYSVLQCHPRSTTLPSTQTLHLPQYLIQYSSPYPISHSKPYSILNPALDVSCDSNFRKGATCIATQALEYSISQSIFCLFLSADA